jgi:hypothetical protein
MWEQECFIVSDVYHYIIISNLRDSVFSILPAVHAPVENSYIFKQDISPLTLMYNVSWTVRHNGFIMITPKTLAVKRIQIYIREVPCERLITHPRSPTVCVKKIMKLKKWPRPNKRLLSH